MNNDSLVLISDVDQTLLSKDARLLPENLNAIRRFREAGGEFTVATGRPTRGIHIYPELLKLISLPAISYNGARLSDVHTREIITQHTLPDTMYETVKAVRAHFPELGCLIFHRADDETFTINRDDLTDEVIYQREHWEALDHSVEGISFPWNKVVFTSHNLPRNEACVRFIAEQNPDVDIVLTEGLFIEISAKNASKGSMVRTLSEYIGVPLSRFMAIGDSVNDLAMLEACGFSAVVANGDEITRKRIGRTVASCDELGVKEFIERYALPRLTEIRG